MTFNYSDRHTLEKVQRACKRNTELQEDLLKAFNAQTAAIERQNDLQEKTLAALEIITNNTAPKVRIVDKPKNKTAL